MRVGNHDAAQPVGLFLDEADIRQNEVDARQGGVRERDADIDHQPLARVRRAEAIEREVHADLADAAKRRKDEFRTGIFAIRLFPARQAYVRA